MSIDMFPDAAVDYLITMADPVSSPESPIKMFVLTPHGPLFEVYGSESDVAHMASATDSIYFWAEGNAEDFAPELSWAEVEALVSTVGLAVNGPTAAENSGANPVSMSNVGSFVVDTVAPWFGPTTDVETDETVSPAPPMESQ